MARSTVLLHWSPENYGFCLTSLMTRQPAQPRSLTHAHALRALLLAALQKPLEAIGLSLEECICGVAAQLCACLTSNDSTAEKCSVAALAEAGQERRRC